MQAAIDLHMHSCLSPCGDDLMTPNNIVNMCLLKGLDIIAVTDHNTAGNLPAIGALAKDAGLALLPGIEVNTAEEVHMLCYFAELLACVEFSRRIYEHLPAIPNRPDYFGHQLILNEQDETTGEEPKLLISALDLSIDELVALCTQHGGISVPAHVNRSANSLLGNLGFVPRALPFAAMEVSKTMPSPPEAATQGYRILHASDAHYLEHILERDEFVDGLSSMSERALFRLLKEGEHSA